MSSSSEFSESSSGKAPTSRSSLNHRCNLLSQYLKEKGGFGDLSLGRSTAQGGEAMGFFPKPKQFVKSMDLFPGESGFGSSKDVVGENNCSSTKVETAQMTLFYGGQVIVFDNFPSDKAKEVMLLASRNSSQFYSTAVSDVTDTITHHPSKAADEPARVVLPTLTHEAIALDLPLSRRNSLHRFLEKRKDRITARAPYPQINGNYTTADKSPLSRPLEDNNKSWLSLSAQRHY